ncbi:ABC transporter substrate-binding protein [Pyrodictium occultum]|nr:ABC transporter substrate-binding protein [Pyrodictium occultum]
MSRSAAIAVGIVVIIIVIAAAAVLMKGGGGAKPAPAAASPSTTAAPATTQTTSTTTAATTATTGTAAATATAGKTMKINVGLLVDLSGPTSDVGKDYARGAELAFKYFNEKGIYTKDGVRVVINYIKRDYGYQPPKAAEFYKEFRDRYHVIAIVGWGTADTEFLSSQVAKDRIFYVSASYSAKLVPQPYNFFPAPDYSTQACAAVAWMAQRKPNATLVLLYDHKVAYSKSPIPAIKAMAEKLGMKVYDVDLPLKASEADATNAVKQAMTYNPDFLWCGNTIGSCSLAARAMAKLGLNAVMVANVWGFDERFPELAAADIRGKAAGVSPWIWPEYAKDKPGYQELYEAVKLYGKDLGISEKDVNLRIMQGFINVWLLVKAITMTTSKDLQEKGGEALKMAIESSCNGEPIKLGDITPPMRYCPGSHLPFRTAYIVVYGEDGQFHFEGPIEAKGVDCVKATLQGGG